MAPHKITMEIQCLSIGEELRLRHIRLLALADAPDAFGSTYAEVAAHPLDMWRQQLQEIATFVAVNDGEDVGLVRCASDAQQQDTALYARKGFKPNGETGSLPAPRDYICEHQRELRL